MFQSALTTIAFLFASAVFADASIPTADRKAAKDEPFLKRYQGSFIVAYEQNSFADFTLPLSRLEQIPGKTGRMNNRLHEPKEKKALEGRYTRLVYLIPQNRSPLEVLRNYQDEITSKGGKILFECKAADCGGDPSRSSGGGGGDMSLAMFLYPEERISDPHLSSGHCAQTENITDQRYSVAELPDVGVHISILSYVLSSPNPHDPCRAFNNRTIALVDIVQAKAREQKMVTVQASEMAKTIAN